MPLLSPIAATVPALVSPALVVILCAAAGVGTVLLLPGARERTVRAIGGAVLAAVGVVFALLVVRATAGHFGGMGVYFWIFSAIALLGAVRVVTHERPVYSALYFVLTVFATAGLFILMWAEFMAAALVLIYAGAILVTYVFVIMLAASAAPAGQGTGPAAGLADADRLSREPVLASAIGFAMMGLLLFVIFDKAETLATPPPVTHAVAAAVPRIAADASVPATMPSQATPAVDTAFGSTQQLGQFLFNNQLVNLELAGMILTIAMVGAIVIARRRVLPHPGYHAANDIVLGPLTPETDDPHSIPVYGTDNPRQKEYPEA